MCPVGLSRRRLGEGGSRPLLHHGVYSLPDRSQSAPRSHRYEITFFLDVLSFAIAGVRETSRAK
jgi:hypothetical protein